MQNKYHVPVMLEECLNGLDINPEGVYLDLTFGGGGHSRAILEKLNGGRLLVFDQDPDAYQESLKIDSSSLIFIKSNFRSFGKYLRVHGVDQVDGILADLGVSSHQFDAVERGFSFRGEADLDMRMNPSQSLSARDVVNEYSPSDLHRLLGMYGEVKNAKTLASAICEARPVNTTTELLAVLNEVAKRGGAKYAAQVFQAIRIEVNDEMKALEEMLMQTERYLTPDGRLVIMTYHSLEDRLVKNYIAKGKFFGEVEKDEFGNLIRPFDPVTRKPVVPDDAEIEMNNRARSAKLRVAKRTQLVR